MTSIHQRANLVFPNFFHEIFSVLAVQKERKLSIGPKAVFFLSFGPMKSLFSSSTAQLRKFRGKKSENKIRGLVV